MLTLVERQLSANPTFIFLRLKISLSTIWVAKGFKGKGALLVDTPSVHNVNSSCND